MKKFFAIVLSVLTLSTISLNVNATNHESKDTSGYHFETKIIVTNSTRSNRSGMKVVTYKNGDNPLWSISITASFTYNGVTSTCISATPDASVVNTNWRKDSLSSSYSGNSATATGTFSCFAGSIYVGSITRDVTLSCDKDGVLY